MFKWEFGDSTPGKGKIKVECYRCGGSGVEECDCTGGCGKRAADDDCYVCGGSGEHTCVVCRGRGYVYEE